MIRHIHKTNKISGGTLISLCVGFVWTSEGVNTDGHENRYKRFASRINIITIFNATMQGKDFVLLHFFNDEFKIWYAENNVK